MAKDQSAGESGGAAQASDPIHILKSRLARGEISIEEFEAARRAMASADGLAAVQNRTLPEPAPIPPPQMGNAATAKSKNGFWRKNWLKVLLVVIALSVVVKHLANYLDRTAPVQVSSLMSGDHIFCLEYETQTSSCSAISDPQVLGDGAVALKTYFSTNNKVGLVTMNAKIVDNELCINLDERPNLYLYPESDWRRVNTNVSPEATIPVDLATALSEIANRPISIATGDKFCFVYYVASRDAGKLKSVRSVVHINGKQIDDKSLDDVEYLLPAELAKLREAK
jgi:hypothetical protein